MFHRFEPRGSQGSAEDGDDRRAAAGRCAFQDFQAPKG